MDVDDKDVGIVWKDVDVELLNCNIVLDDVDGLAFKIEDADIDVGDGSGAVAGDSNFCDSSG